MKKGFTPRELTLLGLLTAILLIMSYTPLGYLNIGPLAITFNMIPVAMGAIALGPVGGAILGGVFGMTSFLQCIGIGGTSAMGVILFEIDPVLTFIQRFLPRLLTGLLAGLIYVAVKKTPVHSVVSYIAGFSAALLNTLLFTLSLGLFLYLISIFNDAKIVEKLLNGQDIVAYILGIIGVNAIIEVITSTIITGLLGKALEKAHLIRR